jgi:hypothetical protein
MSEHNQGFLCVFCGMMGGPMHIGDVRTTDNRYSCKVSIMLNKRNKKPTTQLV